PHPLSTRPSSDAALPAPSRDLTHAASPSAEGPARITASEPRPASAPQPSAPRPAAPRPGLEILQGGGGGSEPRSHPPDAAAALLLSPIPPGICPSCLRERAAIEARCAGCGLDFLKADPAAFAPSARLSRAWAALTERWEEAPAHARFLQGARAANELREAARLYRLHLLASPGDPHAQGALEKLVAETLAMANLSRAERPDADGLRAQRRQRLLVAVLLLSLLLAGLAMM